MANLITPQFERYVAEQTVARGSVQFDEFIFANIPGLNENNLAQYLTMPTSAQIVHRQAVSQSGVINENAVVYSVTIGTEVGDFDFNFIGLINRSKNLLAVAVQTDTVKKIRNKNAVQGNSITRNILLEFTGAKALTGINVNANTWQIDFTVRLHGLDEKIRLTNRDLYGRAVFFDDSFLVKRKTGNQFTIQPGTAYVEGIRMDLGALYNLTANNLPCSVYADLVHHCTVTGEYQTEIKYLTQSKADYLDTANRQHYVQILADIDSQGNVTDRRLLSPFLGMNPLTLDDTTENTKDKRGHTHKLPIASLVKKGIVKLFSGYDSDAEDMAATPKAIKGLKALIDAITRNLGNYIPNSKKSSAVNSNSADTVATSAAVKTANDNANGRVSKSGDTMTGDLSIKSGEYSKLKLYNASGKEFRFESTPDSQQVFGKASYRSEDGATEYYAQYFQKKSGTIALTNEVLLNSGNQSIRGALKAENVGSAWANYQWGANQGMWQLEVHPDSHTSSNRRFNMVWIPKSGNQVYLSFPHIGENGETVAYQTWVNAELQKVRSITNQNSQNFSNYIHNNKKSNAVDSTSTDTLATSRAVKLAYDRGTTALNTANNANNNANGRVSKSGDTMTGNLHIKKGDYSAVITYNMANEQVRWESMPTDPLHFAKITQVDSRDKVLGAVYVPKKNGTMALLEDFTQNLSDNGWCKLPNGLILQWGKSTSGNILFPMAFPVACFVVSHSKTGGGRDTRVSNISKTGFSSHATGDVGTTYYMAIGK